MRSIEIIARGVYIQRDCLLACKMPHSTSYSYLPGGHVEFGETLVQALQREWQEELGCQCYIKKFIHFFECHFIDAQQQARHEYSFLFYVDSQEVPSTEFQSPTESNLIFYWIPIQQLQTSSLLPHSIRDYLANSLK